jgi:hypothetical protein
MANDQDVLGRIWALQQLVARMNDDKTTGVDRLAIIKVIGDQGTKDKFWGTRLDAVAALNGLKEAGDALLAATKDPNARVRARAVTSLAATKDAELAGVYQQMLNDPSYGVIRAAALALGQTKSPYGFEALAKLIETPSWRNTIRASGLAGLAALGDKRALELGLRYAGTGNPNAVRTPALALVGAAGKDDPRSFSLISAALNDALERRNPGLFAATGEALVSLADERGLALLGEIRKKPGLSPQTLTAISGIESRLRAKLTPAASKP